MNTAKPVSLSVRPFQVSHLSFEVDGIVEESNPKLCYLGASVVAFDFPTFYATLGSVPTVPGGDGSRLLYDFSKIEDYAAKCTLVTLRKEARKAALNKAINARQNAYYAKYGNAPTIISLMNKYYSLSVLNSKPNRLANLSALANLQAFELQAAYTSDSRTGVVKETMSDLNSSTESSGGSAENGKSTETGQSNEEVIAIPDVAGTVPAPPGGGQDFSASWSEPVNVDLQEGGSTVTSTSHLTSTSSGLATQSQTIVNTDYGYRIPYLESQAQNERAQISLIDQQFAQFMAGLNLPNLVQIFQNELNSIDDDIYRLQIAYLNTILMSPISGTVTGIYKHPGDAVRAGEPVVRVEDNSVILLLATLVYRGPIAIGSTVTVKTTLFDSSSSPTTVSGPAVAVRGSREDDQWEVIVKCPNLDGSGNPILPLGYHFDYDDTTVSIT